MQTFSACLEWLPDGGRESLMRDINDQEDDDGLFLVFQNLCTGLFSKMRSQSRPPSVTESPIARRSRNSEVILSQLDEPKMREKRFREGLFIRDQYRCVVTGCLDKEEWRKLGKPSEVDYFGPVEGAHIIPFSYAHWTPN
ncbi:hypothetical protein N7488_000720 [Penicillium malachiteum]|nr:hypothetical protein N7488_000720 [Penicillium malachiteum]